MLLEVHMDKKVMQKSKILVVNLQAKELIPIKILSVRQEKKVKKTVSSLATEYRELIDPDCEKLYRILWFLQKLNCKEDKIRWRGSLYVKQT